MNRPITGIRPAITRLLAAFVAIAALGLGALAQPAQAKPSVNPETPVSSDGSGPASVPEVAVRGTSGFAGRAPQPASAESIYGPTDSRVRVNPTTTYPARATVYIAYNGSAWCSGWMIGPDTLATAGHCVAPGGGGTFYDRTKFVIYAGSNGTTKPYGSCTAKRLHSVSGWTSSNDSNYDYGAIKLNCSVGNTVGWYGMYWTTASLNGTVITTQGYPGDKPAGQQWKSSGTVMQSGTNQLFYTNDTIGGQSGSPVWQYRSSGPCTGYCGLAIHAYGIGGGSPYNRGTRIRDAVFNNMISWRNAA